MVPVLILLAVALMAFKPTPKHGAERDHVLPATGGTFLTGIYGGYFGAAQGVILLAVLRLAFTDDLQRLNAVKNVLASLANGVAAVLFVVFAAHRLGCGGAARGRLDRRRRARRALRPAAARAVAAPDRDRRRHDRRHHPDRRLSSGQIHAVPCTTVHDRAATPLLSAERRQAILDTLERDGKVVAARLVDDLHVSEDTVRRDLRELAAQGLVQRVHGGALQPAPQQGSFSSRRATSADAKPALAAGGGRPPRARARGDPRRLDHQPRARAPPPAPARTVTVLTNSPPIAAVLADHPSAEVVVIGGRLDKRAQVTVGAAAVDFIRTVRADACVLGVCALHPEAGLSTDDLEEAHVKRAMVEASADVIALATADKLRAGSAYLVAPVAELTHWWPRPTRRDELLDPYRAAGVTVTRA